MSADATGYELPTAFEGALAAATRQLALDIAADTDPLAHIRAIQRAAKSMALPTRHSGTPWRLAADALLEQAANSGAVEEFGEETVAVAIKKYLYDFTEPESLNGHADAAPPAREASQQRLILSSAEFIEGFVPPAYLLDGILQRGFFYSLTGHTGSGKTAVAMQLMACVALARPLGKHEVERGRVLYFAGENPDDIRMRWIGMAANMDFDPAAIDVDFIPGTFKISAMEERITKEVEARGPVALVVVDTSAAFFEGDDENSNPQHGIHARRLRGLVNLPGKPCVIVNCHPPKNAPNDKLTPRGGGAFIAEVDGNMTCSKTDGMVVELHWQGKFRGPDFAPILFQLVPVTAERLRDAKGRLIPTVMARYLSDGASEEMAAAARDNENRLLQAIANDPGASLAQLAARLGWTTRNGDPNKVMAQRARDKLKEAKLIVIERGKAVVSDKGGKLLASLKNPAS